MIGRGARLHPDKENCHIIDMVSSLDTGVVTAPTLFGLDPSELLEQADMDRVEELKKQRGEQDESRLSTLNTSTSSGELSGTLRFTDYDSVHDLIDDSSGERHIRAISSNAWVQVDSERYVLETQKGKLTIKGAWLERGEEVQARSVPQNDTETETDGMARGFVVEYAAAIPVAAMSRAPYAKVREIARAWIFADAVHAADTFAEEKFEHVFISLNVAWRSKPASEGQLAFLERAHISDHPLKPEQITKGKAADMITKIKHGAQGRFTKMQVVKRQQQKKRSKASSLAQREKVAVGPLSI